MKTLNQEFLNKFKTENPFPTALGEMVFYRTYARPLPELKRRETWFEVCKRVVEYNCNLDPKITAEEMEKAFELIFNMKFLPSGRTLWVGGTEIAKKFPLANFNCCFVALDEIEKFSEIFYLLMLGCGVGISVEKKYVNMLPKISNKPDLINKEYNYKGAYSNDVTVVENIGDDIKITVGDSKEGWRDALIAFLEVFVGNNSYKNIEINYDNVRPKGTPLKTFGGTASGHEALQKMFVKIHNSVEIGSFTPLNVLDIATSIAENVVSGGVRRSSEIILCDPDETDVINAKNDLYTQTDGVWSVNENLIHRQFSNNTIMYQEKPSREQLHNQFEQMRYSGEPAFANFAEMKRRKETTKGGNPCFEILLNDRQCCNLVEIIMPNNTADELKETQEIASRWCYRMSTVELELEKWHKVNEEERLVGISLTGIQDYLNSANMTAEETEKMFQNLREITHNTVENYAKDFNMECPPCMTTIKPSGTLSQLPTVSSGLHYSHAPYFIRRVRVATADPLFNAMVDMGYNYEPEVGQNRENCIVGVFEFPVKAPQGKTKDNASAIEQLEFYKMIMQNYVDHNASNTIHVRNNEWEAVEQWVFDNWDYVVGITFLSHDDNFYELLPYEEISQEKYDEMLEKTPEFDISYLAKHEDFEEHEILDTDCAGGVCPIR